MFMVCGNGWLLLIDTDSVRRNVWVEAEEPVGHRTL
jgi:hypothetical protein